MPDTADSERALYAYASKQHKEKVSILVYATRLHKRQNNAYSEYEILADKTCCENRTQTVSTEHATPIAQMRLFYHKKARMKLVMYG